MPPTLNNYVPQHPTVRNHALNLKTTCLNIQLAETTPSTLNNHIAQRPNIRNRIYNPKQPHASTSNQQKLRLQPLTTTCLNIQLAGRNHAFNPQQPLASTYNWQKPHLQPSTTTCLNIQLADITPSTLNNHVPQHPSSRNHAFSP